MENATDALKMAFAMMVFVLAVGMTFIVFSQVRYIADLVFFVNDKTNFETYMDSLGVEDQHRTVGLETVVSAVRRYVNDNENYSVEIIN